MDIQGTAKNVLGKLEDNAMLLTVLGASYARMSEDGDAINGLIHHFTTFSTTDGVVSELLADFGLKAGSGDMAATLKWKLWDSPHLYTLLIKLGIGAYLAGELGFIGARYKKLGVNVGKGAAIAALLMPGSGNSQQTPQNTMSKSVYALGMQQTSNPFTTSMYK